MGDPDKVVEAVEFSRRSFVKKLLATGFALPVVSSFALNVGSAHGLPKGHDTQDENIFMGNQSIFIGNQSLGQLNCRLPHGHKPSCFGNPI